MEKYVFNRCQAINDLLNQGSEDLARDELIN